MAGVDPPPAATASPRAPARRPAGPPSGGLPLNDWLVDMINQVEDGDNQMDWDHAMRKFTAQPPLGALEETIGAGDAPLARRPRSDAALDRYVTCDATMAALAACQKDLAATEAHAAAVAATWASQLRGGDAGDLGAWAGAVCATGVAYRRRAAAEHGGLLAAVLLLDWAAMGLRLGALQGLPEVDVSVPACFATVSDLLDRCAGPLAGVFASVSKRSFQGGGVKAMWTRAYMFHLSRAFRSMYYVLNALEDINSSAAQGLGFYTTVLPCTFRALEVLDFHSVAALECAGKHDVWKGAQGAGVRIALGPTTLAALGQLLRALAASEQQPRSGAGRLPRESILDSLVDELRGVASMARWVMEAVALSMTDGNASPLGKFLRTEGWCGVDDAAKLFVTLMHTAMDRAIKQVDREGGEGPSRARVRVPYVAAPNALLTLCLGSYVVVTAAMHRSSGMTRPLHLLHLLVTPLARACKQGRDGMIRLLFSSTPDMAPLKYLTHALNYCSHVTGGAGGQSAAQDAAVRQIVEPVAYVYAHVATASQGPETVANNLAGFAVGPLCDVLRNQLRALRSADGKFRPPTRDQEDTIRALLACLTVICSASIELPAWPPPAGVAARADRVSAALYRRGLLDDLARLLAEVYCVPGVEVWDYPDITLELPPSVSIAALLALTAREDAPYRDVVLGLTCEKALEAAGFMTVVRGFAAVDARGAAPAEDHRLMVLRSVQSARCWLAIAVFALQARRDHPNAFNLAATATSALSLAARVAKEFLADPRCPLPTPSVASLRHELAACYCCWAPYQAHRLLGSMFDMVRVERSPGLLPALRPHLAALGPVWSDIQGELAGGVMAGYQLKRVSPELLGYCGGPFWRGVPTILEPYARAHAEVVAAGKRNEEKERAAAAAEAAEAAAALLAEEEGKAAAAAAAEEKKRLKRQRQKEKQRAAKEAAEAEEAVRRAAEEAVRREKEEQKRAAAEERRRAKEAEAAARREQEEEGRAVAEEKKRRAQEAAEAAEANRRAEKDAAAKRRAEEKATAAAATKRRAAEKAAATAAAAAAAAEAKRKEAEAEAAAVDAAAEAAEKRRIDEAAAALAARAATAQVAPPPAAAVGVSVGAGGAPKPAGFEEDDLGSLLSLLLPGMVTEEAAPAHAPSPAPVPLVPAAHPPHTPLAAAIASPGSWQRLEAVLRCPASGKVLRDPVVLMDGLSYDRAAAGALPAGGAAGARPNHAMRQLLRFVTGLD